MNRNKTIAGIMTAALILISLSILAAGAADLTDEGLLNEQQEQIIGVDLENEDTEDLTQQLASQPGADKAPSKNSSNPAL